MDTKAAILENKTTYFQRISKAERYIRLGFYNKAVDILSNAANFAWSNYCGFVCDERIENILVKIGRKFIHSKEYNKQHNPEKLSILHVATELSEIGGHSKFLENWINIDNNNSHSIVVTRQTGSDLSSALKARYKSDFTFLGKHNYIKRAIELNKLASGYDLVVMHHNPNDLVPIIAFSAANIPPVLILNHADHAFWVGSAVCDGLIQIRGIYLPLDAGRRHINNQYLLPIPVNRAVLSVSNKAHIQLVSIGSASKYMPDEHYNFFTAIIGILNECPDVSLKLVGIDPEHPLAKQYQHSRLVYVKPTKDISRILSESSIYVEGFPLSSFTAMLEAISYGLACQLRFAPLKTNNLYIDSYGDKWKYPANVTAWKKELVNLITSEHHRQDNASYFSSCLTNHEPAAIKNTLKNIYQDILKKKHKVRLLQESNYIEDPLEDELLFANAKNITIPFIEKELLKYKWKRYILKAKQFGRKVLYSEK